jgi:hypothetical protein
MRESIVAWLDAIPEVLVIIAAVIVVGICGVIGYVIDKRHEGGG